MENKTIYALLLGVLLVLGSCNDDASNQNPQDSQLDNDSFGEEENVLDVYPNHYGKNGDLVKILLCRCWRWSRFRWYCFEGYKVHAMEM